MATGEQRSVIISREDGWVVDGRRATTHMRGVSFNRQLNSGSLFMFEVK